MVEDVGADEIERGCGEGEDGRAEKQVKST